MKHSKSIIIGLLCSATLLNAGWLDSFKDIVSETTDTYVNEISPDKKETVITDLTSPDMNGALKEALNIGVDYAVKSLGAKDGYLNNPLTKIGLPKDLKKTADLVRKVGGDKYVDDLILAFNNAATEAAPKTAEIFAKSISDMSIDDAKKILSGSDKAATDYFRKSSTKELQNTILPIIQKSMDNNNVAMYYGAFQSFYKENAGVLNNEYVSSAASMLGYGGMIPREDDEDLNSYITNKSIDGLMVMIEEKEKEIRDNPLLQNNDLIKKVFSVFE
ncbi:MAG: DUF4197 domain-containing protein [Campylobacterota bacterium]